MEKVCTVTDIMIALRRADYECTNEEAERSWTRS